MAERLSCVSVSPYRRLSQTNCSLLSRSRERSRRFFLRNRLRHPSRIRRAFPVTVLLRLPVPCSTVERRFQHCSVSGFPLRCLKSCRPSSQVFHVQERLGLPKFFDVSLPACHGLRTPADLHNLATSVALMLPSGALKPSASAIAMSKLYQHFRVRGHPYGLQDVLSTLRPSCSPLYLTTPPWTQDAIRVG